MLEIGDACSLYTSAAYTQVFMVTVVKHLDYLLGKSLFTTILINGSNNALLIKLQGSGLCENA